jgi:hypothetical protein
MSVIRARYAGLLGMGCLLACGVASVCLAGPPTQGSPAGAWLIPTKSQDGLTQTLSTSIGTLRFVDVDDRNGIHTRVSLNGKRIPLWDDTDLLSLDRVLDFGNEIDVVFFSHCSGSSYDCHAFPAAAHVNGTGKITSSINLEHHPILEGEEGEAAPVWTSEDGRQTTLLERQGARVREAILQRDRVLIAIRPGRPDELAALRTIEATAAANWCDQLYWDVQECAEGGREECAKLDPGDPSSLSWVLNERGTPWALIPERGRVADVAFPLDRVVKACRRACDTHTVPDKPVFTAAICGSSAQSASHNASINPTRKSP